jgi:hypothetical protein
VHPVHLQRDHTGRRVRACVLLWARPLPVCCECASVLVLTPCFGRCGDGLFPVYGGDCKASTELYGSFIMYPVGAAPHDNDTHSQFMGPLHIGLLLVWGLRW